MFKKMKLSYKLIGGFSIVLVLLALVTGIYQFTVKKITLNQKNVLETDIAIANHASNLNMYMMQCRRNEKDFLLRKDIKYIKKLNENIDGLKLEVNFMIDIAKKVGDQKLIDDANKIVIYADEYNSSFYKVEQGWKLKGLDYKSGLQGKFRNLARDLGLQTEENQVEGLYISLLQTRRYEKDFQRTKSDKYKTKWFDSIGLFEFELSSSSVGDDKRQHLQEALGLYVTKAKGFVASPSEELYGDVRTAASKLVKAVDDLYVPNIKSMLLTLRKHEKDYLLRGDPNYVKKVSQSLNKIKSAYKFSSVDKSVVDLINSLLNDYSTAFSALVAQDNAIDLAVADMRSSVHKIEPLVKQLKEQANEAATLKAKEAASQADKSSIYAMIVSAFAFIIGSFLALFISNSIKKPISLISDNLNHGSMQTAAAASQVSSASQQLSHGATEQAASFEEISSALDEVLSMTRQNSENTDVASQLATAAREAASEGSGAMLDMQNAMEKINTSSDNISKIIKTIEEIAFQTNLLALNAAVEAARAGEHGKGFAVVADEVRNLAQSAAGAAKDTTVLIEDCISKAKDGGNVALKATESLNKIELNTTKVADLIVEIAQASKEQSEGICQVTNAVGQMDQVTQNNASASEECAASAEELSSQAEVMKGVVLELQQIVYGAQFNEVEMSEANDVHRTSIGTIELHKERAVFDPRFKSKIFQPGEILPFDKDSEIEQLV